jgi:selenocysteine lyase/cysteine desulfurase
MCKVPTIVHMNPEALRAEIPALERTVYLNTGASGPAPRRVVEAVEDVVERHEFEAPAGQGKYQAAFEVFEDTRATVADHVGTDAENVALAQSTGDGIGRLAAAMDWEAGDVVVRTDLEHPAGVLPWERLQRQAGVETRVVHSERGHLDHEAYREAVEGAELVCLSSVCWTTGTRLPVAELTEIAHDAGARVLVDAVQSVGQHPVDVESWGADAVAASGHKWLLATWGSGFLYVDPDFAPELDPAHVGYFAVEDPPSEGYELKPGARRMEVGTRSLAPCAGLQEGIATIESVGYDAVESRIERLTDRLKAGLDDDRLRSPADYESGLVSFRVEDAESTVERLQSAGIRVRSIPVPDTVRASIHVFNTAEDVDELLSAL